MKNIQCNVSDIFHFEKKLKQMIHEFQQNIRELDNLEKECFLIREELCSKNSLLQNERKISNKLQVRLELALETTNRLEEEKVRDKIDYSNLSLKYESLLKENNILAKETLFSQTEAAKFKLKIESLENMLLRETRRKEELEKILAELKNDHEKIFANININMNKISKEQKYLIESAKDVIQLNKRLQTFGLCFHAINEKNKAEIKNLQCKLIALSTNKSNQLPSNNKLHPEIENLCYKLKEMLVELKLKLQDSALYEEKLNRIFNELPS